MKKRILSMILAICLVLSCVPITVFAANADATDLQNLLNGGGTVTLSKDYTIDTTLNVKNTVTLDLNGHVIKMTGSNSVISVAWGNLTLQDSNKTATHTDTSLPAGGVITGGNVYGGVYVGSGDFTMNGGTIQGCSAEYGGGVAVMAGSFTMTGGTIANCKATTSNYAVGGGGVYVAQNSNFTMNGGTIENCSAASTFGGGVCSYGNSSMSGNAIIRGCSAKAGGGVRIDNSSMTINGGTIEGCASTSGTSDAVMIVDAHLLANGGIVKGMVTFGSNSAITTTSTDSYTKFYNEVTNSSTISGGVYYGGIQNKSSGTVSGTYHTVSFDSNGGSGSVPTQWFVNTDKAPALQPADPTKNGYQAFDGWYNGDTRYDFSQPVTQDITLTAKFSNPKTYNISYVLDGGTATNPATYNVESDAITLNNPVKTGYTFTGWSGTGLTGENNITVTITQGSTGDRTYTAHFSQNNYTVNFDTNGGSSISDKTGVKWTDTVLDGITATTKNGWEFTGWKCGDMTVNTNTKYSDLVANDTVKSVTLVAQWKDITAPTGEISIGTNKWNGFLNTITFGLFFKNTQSVTITASDNSGEDVTIEYLLSDKGLNKIDLASKEFTEYGSAFNINPDNKYVVYARLTDHAGNVTYISSNGIVLDATVPVISGIENGKTYCEAQTVTVTEEYIESVKVNGTAVTLDANKRFILNPADGTQTIVVTDKAGNVSAEMIVTVNDGHTDNSKDHNCDYCGVTLSKHSGGFSTCSSRAKCDYCGQYYGSLDYNWHHLEHINAVPATESKTGNKEYWHCLDCGKYFADEKGTNEIKLDDTVISKLPPEIIEGKGQSIVAGENKELSFTSNAAFNDFLRVELDGKILDEKNYTATEGSTIVTLKADYVATLSAGEHTIGIVSESGTAETTFTVNAKAVEDEKEMKSPETGNGSEMALWIALILSCGGAIVVTSSYGKRKKHSR